jgi:hypothetical protein
MVFEFFFKSVEKVKLSLNSDKNNGHFTWRPMYVCDGISLFFHEWEMLQTKVKGEIKTHILYWVTFFQKMCLWGYVEKCHRARQVTDQTKRIIWHLCFASWITHTHLCVLVHTHLCMRVQTHMRARAHTHSLCLSLSRYTVVCQIVAVFVSPTWHNRHTALKDNATRGHMVILWSYVPGLQSS